MAIPAQPKVVPQPKKPKVEEVKREKMDFIDQLAYDTMLKKANRKANAPVRVWSDSQSESTDSETERQRVEEARNAYERLYGKLPPAKKKPQRQNSSSSSSGSSDSSDEQPTNQLDKPKAPLKPDFTTNRKLINQENVKLQSKGLNYKTLDQLAPKPKMTSRTPIVPKTKKIEKLAKLQQFMGKIASEDTEDMEFMTSALKLLNSGGSSTAVFGQ